MCNVGKGLKVTTKIATPPVDILFCGGHFGRIDYNYNLDGCYYNVNLLLYGQFYALSVNSPYDRLHMARYHAELWPMYDKSTQKNFNHQTAGALPAAMLLVMQRVRLGAP